MSPNMAKRVLADAVRILIVARDKSLYDALVAGMTGDVYPLPVASLKEARNRLADADYAAILVEDAVLDHESPLNIIALKDHARGRTTIALLARPDGQARPLAPEMREAFDTEIKARADEKAARTMQAFLGDLRANRRKGGGADGDIRALMVPHDLPESFLPANIKPVVHGTENPDIILLTAPSAVHLLQSHAGLAASILVPVIDLTGAHEDIADLVVAPMTSAGLFDAILTVRPIIERVRHLPRSIYQSQDERRLLLARLMVRDGDCVPHYDPHATTIVRYRDDKVFAAFLPLVESAVRMGFLERRFFDKVHICPTCGSGRLVVREECMSCRSPDVHEVQVIHHLKCGYQAPETDFMQGDDLVCPSCSRHLEHFTYDYDKPSSMMVCGGCGHTTGETAIGFKCLDCTAHHDTEQVGTRSYFSYRLTERGRQEVMKPSAASGLAVMGSEANTIKDALNEFATVMKADERAFSLLMLRPDASGSVRREHGPRALDQCLILIARALREYLPRDHRVLAWQSGFLVLMPDHTEEAAKAAETGILAAAQKPLKLPIDIRADILSGDRIMVLL